MHLCTTSIRGWAGSSADTFGTTGVKEEPSGFLRLRRSSSVSPSTPWAEGEPSEPGVEASAQHDSHCHGGE